MWVMGKLQPIMGLRTSRIATGYGNGQQSPLFPVKIQNGLVDNL